MSNMAHTIAYFLHERKIVIRTALAVMVIALAASFAQPLKYGVTSQFLIIERGAFSADPYTSIRSSERIGDHLARIVHTSDFLEKVRASGFAIAPNIFPTEERRVRRLWGKMVETNVARGTGLLTVVVYHQDKNQATQISRAIASILTTRAPEYIGGDIGVKLVDPPLASRFPVKPNILGNAVSGLVLGLILGIGYVYLRAMRRAT